MEIEIIKVFKDVALGQDLASADVMYRVTNQELVKQDAIIKAVQNLLIALTKDKKFKK